MKKYFTVLMMLAAVTTFAKKEKFADPKNFPQEKAILTHAPLDRPVIKRRAPARVVVDLESKEVVMRDLATEFGATGVINNSDGKAVEKIMELTKNRGVDVAIEAVGIPDTFNICQSILAPGGHLANIGVHGKSVDLHLEKLWDRNVPITTRLVDTQAISMLLQVLLKSRH